MDHLDGLEDLLSKQDREVDALQQALRSRLAQFVEAAKGRGVHPLPLETYDGRRTYKTAVSGWVLFPDTNLAVGSDGELYRFYVSGGWLGNKAPRRVEQIQRSYWHGWCSTQVSLEEMLADAFLRGISDSRR